MASEPARSEIVRLTSYLPARKLFYSLGCGDSSHLVAIHSNFTCRLATAEVSPMFNLLNVLWSDEGQDIAEYAVMLAVILVLVVGTIRLVGSNANNAFSSVASSLQ